MKREYEEWNPTKDTWPFIHAINDIITRYLRAGLKLSVRQVYYQLVAHAGLPNTERSYHKVQGIINKGRLAGLIDWDAIEDRNRDIEMQQRWESGAQIIDACARGYHMDMWLRQEHRVLVIVEKAALAGVLERACRTWDVPLLAARGYPSVSIVREMVLDHVAPAILDHNQFVTVLHLGDHDPSGIDMTRDLEDRFRLFLREEVGDDDPFSLERIALSMDQIEELKPPPNPAKTTDSRFIGYRRRYGDESWELDALDPDYLHKLIESHITKHIDKEVWKDRREEVEAIRDELDKVAVRFARKGI